MDPEPGALRIGEFSRRVGVSTELLRAWERRYGLLSPIRSGGGFRLYTDADAARVARMRHAIDEGMSAAEAARHALATPARSSVNLLGTAVERMLVAIEAFDEATMQAVFDETLAGFGLEPVLAELVIPVLREVGRRWQNGVLDISHEHFASNLLRERLLSLGRLWGRGSGPLAILACVPQEDHDLSLAAFGLLLRSHGWRILFLGANTPIVTVEQTVLATSPRIVVFTTFKAANVAACSDQLRELSTRTALYLSGPGASTALCDDVGAVRLDGDLIQAAHQVARLTHTGGGAAT